MNSYKLGTWIKRDGYRSFEPSPINRPWRIDEPRVLEALSRADRQLGRLAEAASVSLPTAYKLIERFLEQKLLREITGAKRDRIFLFEPYLQLFR
jgi:hypothetical protein